MGIFKRILNKINSILKKGISLYAKYFMKAPKILSVDQTLDLIIKDRYSVSRNGDGELNLLIGQSIDFQKADNNLARLLGKALNAKIPKYISCLPDVFEDYSNLNAKAQGYYANHLSTRRFAYYHNAKAPIYGNTFITRFYIDTQDKKRSKAQIDKLKGIWANQDVILIEGKDSRLGVNNDLFEQAKSLRRILGPSKHAFSHHDELLSKVKEVASYDCLILLALGPTATVMAYELAEEGYWAVDIGHIDIEYEWFLMGATKKVAIPGKYTNECEDTKFIGELPSEAIEKYKSEIICEII